MDADEIAAESVVDATRTMLKFERCHIRADWKGIRGLDTTGNHIPLPVDWHRYFDGYTNTDIALISMLAAADVVPELPARADGRVRVDVDVYFNPALGPEEIADLARKLRDARQIAPSLYRVSVFKQEPDKFRECLRYRHDSVVQQWASIPAGPV